MSSDILSIHRVSTRELILMSMRMMIHTELELLWLCERRQDRSPSLTLDESTKCHSTPHAKNQQTLFAHHGIALGLSTLLVESGSRVIDLCNCHSFSFSIIQNRIKATEHLSNPTLHPTRYPRRCPVNSAMHHIRHRCRLAATRQTT